MNKLREKLKTDVSINTSGEAERFAKQCEQITDDFSVKFFHWIHSEESKIEVDKLNPKEMNIKTTTELLQIFKEKHYETNN